MIVTANDLPGLWSEELRAAESDWRESKRRDEDTWLRAVFGVVIGLAPAEMGVWLLFVDRAVHPVAFCGGGVAFFLGASIMVACAVASVLARFEARRLKAEYDAAAETAKATATWMLGSMSVGARLSECTVAAFANRAGELVADLIFAPAEPLDKLLALAQFHAVHNLSPLSLARTVQAETERGLQWSWVDLLLDFRRTGFPVDLKTPVPAEVLAKFRELLAASLVAENKQALAAQGGEEK